jgi:outer membrane lipoprotein-sorting protein
MGAGRRGNRQEGKDMGRGRLVGAAGLWGVYCLIVLGLPSAHPAAGVSAGEIIRNMEKAWAGIDDYRTRVEVTTFADDGSGSVEKFLYSFKKPDRIRLDFEEPHPGLTVIYPDENGKVFVRPSGLARLFTFHLSPESRLLAVSPGQRIDQTDMGRLIRNIARSLTEGRLGRATISEEGGVISIRVLAADHFLAGKATLYRFLIDGKVWLPKGVEEATPSGKMRRIVTFRDLKTNVGIPDDFFRTDGGGDNAGG